MKEEEYIKIETTYEMLELLQDFEYLNKRQQQTVIKIIHKFIEENLKNDEK